MANKEYKYEIEVIFTRPKKETLLTKIVLAFTKWWLKGTQYEGQEPTHVAILLDDRRVVEALPFKGVRVIDFDKWLEDNNIIERRLFTQYLTRSEIFEIVRKFYGKDYDFLGAAFAGIYSISRQLFKKRLINKNWLESKNKFFCVELVFAFYEEYDFLGFDKNWRSLISPAEFLRYLENQYRG